jgi:hypothetical protein
LRVQFDRKMKAFEFDMKKKVKMAEEDAYRQAMKELERREAKLKGVVERLEKESL